MYDSKNGAFAGLPTLAQKQINTIINLGYRPIQYNKKNINYDVEFSTELEAIKKDINFDIVFNEGVVYGGNRPYLIQNLTFSISGLRIDTTGLNTVKINNYVSPFALDIEGLVNTNPLVVSNVSVNGTQDKEEEIKFSIIQKIPNALNEINFVLEYQFGNLGNQLYTDTATVVFAENGFGGTAYISSGFSQETKDNLPEKYWYKLTGLVSRAVQVLSKYAELKTNPTSYEPELSQVTDVETYGFLTEYDQATLNALRELPSETRLGFAIYDEEQIPNGVIHSVHNGISTDSKYLNTTRCEFWGLLDSWNYDTGRGLIRWSGKRAKFPFDFGALENGFMNLPNTDDL